MQRFASHEGVEDFHFHLLEPRNVRVYLSWKF